MAGFQCEETRGNTRKIARQLEGKSFSEIKRGGRWNVHVIRSRVIWSGGNNPKKLVLHKITGRTLLPINLWTVAWKYRRNIEEISYKKRHLILLMLKNSRVKLIYLLIVDYVQTILLFEWQCLQIHLISCVSVFFDMIRVRKIVAIWYAIVKTWERDRVSIWNLWIFDFFLIPGVRQKCNSLIQLEINFYRKHSFDRLMKDNWR